MDTLPLVTEAAEQQSVITVRTALAQRGVSGRVRRLVDSAHTALEAAEAVVNDLSNQMPLPSADVPAPAGELVSAIDKAEADQKGSVTHKVVRPNVPIRGVWPELDDDERRNYLRPWPHSISFYPRGTDPHIRVNRQADIDYWVTVNSDEELNAD